jgi:AraC-like DNA-binding protein
MSSESPSVSSRRPFFAAFAATVLICLCGTEVSAVEAAQKKPAKASKPVFSVSVPESAVTLPVAQQSTAAARVPDSAIRKADTVNRSGASSAAAINAALSVPQPGALKPVVRHEPKKAADTLTNAMPVSALKAPAKVAVSLKKHSPLGRSFVFRIIVFLGSIVVIAAAIRYVKKQKSSPRFLTTTRLSVMDKEVQHACRYIEKNFADPGMSVKNVCRDLITGEAFLEALMERDLGVTVNDFISHVRINRAKQLLAKDPSSGSDAIARETGFASGAVFLATFKKLTGTPFDSYTDQRRKN